MSDRGVFERFGYDPDDPVPRDDEGQRIIPDKLLRALGQVAFVAQPATPDVQVAKLRRELAETLTVRETEVLLMVCEGHRYREIGERLFMSPDTVSDHMWRIRMKLGDANTNAGAVAVAFRRGLIS